MNILSSEIEQHYHQPELYNQIIRKLTIKGFDINNLSQKDIAGVDEFHVRGEEISRELAKIAKLNNSKLLDIGCGIGGPCRLLAGEFNCITTGVDLSKEYIKTATALSKLVGLNNCTNFIQGNATNLPFEDNKFDVVWTQHLLVNISNRDKLYSEIDRVLNKNGTFIYYDVFKKGNINVKYPMPWAEESKISFIEPTSEMASTLSTLGFKKIHTTDQTEIGIQFFEKLLHRISKYGIPKLGLSILMGESFINKITNFLSALKEENIILESGIYKK